MGEGTMFPSGQLQLAGRNDINIYAGHTEWAT